MFIWCVKYSVCFSAFGILCDVGSFVKHFVLKLEQLINFRFGITNVTSSLVKKLFQIKKFLLNIIAIDKESLCN